MSEPRPSSATEEPDARPAEATSKRHSTRDMPLVQPVPGEVVDMSAGGVGVLTRDALPVDKELHLSFGPPGQRVRVCARVIWCRLRATEAGVDWTPKYRAGIQFLEFPT